MPLLKKLRKNKNTTIEVFSSRIGGRNLYFVSKVSPKRIRTGEARDKAHALAWAKRLSKPRTKR